MAFNASFGSTPTAVTDMLAWEILESEPTYRPMKLSLTHSVRLSDQWILIIEIFLTCWILCYPVALIEQQVYRNTMALKSKQTNKYVCYNAEAGNFILKSIHELDRYCIFFYSIQKQNQYTFAIGSNKAIYLSFNRIGRSISARFFKRKFPSCPENTNIFNVITKATDYVKASKPPIVIVYEAKKPIKSYSLKNGYQSIFYSTLEHNYVTRTLPFESTTTPTTTTTTTTTAASTIRNYNVYEV